ncbi:MAG TPA: hypothetical protein VJ001_12440 [Rhodocyclaceae bacterium]|nr:hypothetical protein [Rhodocyclaceae bacterium]
MTSATFDPAELFPARYTLSVDAQKVALASAALCTYRANTYLMKMLRIMGLRRQDGKPFELTDVKEASSELESRRLKSRDTNYGWRLIDPLRQDIYREMLKAGLVAQLPAMIETLDAIQPVTGTHSS